jgi:hypothetical protein
MQNKKYNKYFEEQNAKPSRVSGNVRKRSSLKKGDYATGLFNDGNGSKSVDPRTWDAPFISPQRPAGYGRNRKGTSGPETAVRGGVPNDYDIQNFRHEQDYQRQREESKKKWLSRPTMDKDVFNQPNAVERGVYGDKPIFGKPFYLKPSKIPPSPFDAYNPVKEFRRKNPIGDRQESWGEPQLNTERRPYSGEWLDNPPDNYRAPKDFAERLWRSYFGPKFNTQSD